MFSGWKGEDWRKKGQSAESEAGPPPKTITRGKKKALLFPPRDEYQGMNGPPAPNPGGQMDNSVGQAKAPHGSSSLGCFRVEATH